MRIAQVAPLIESVPPGGYGGTERIVAYLVEALVDTGNEVTLFASADSSTRARLVPCARRALRLDDECVDTVAHHVRMMDMVREMQDQFDVIHWHIDYLSYPLQRLLRTPGLTTLHGRLDLPDLAPLYEAYCDIPVVSISSSQREPVPWAGFIATVYHGIPTSTYTPREHPGDYLAFVGRICAEKGIARAIEISQRTGIPLKIAAKVDKVDRDYFEAEIRHLIQPPLIEFVGEIDDAGKDQFLGNALALLFQIDWPEPFGLAMIEAMACGTPVIARPRGSVREVVEEGVTGFIAESVEEAVAAVHAAIGFDRLRCRARFEQRFSATRMAGDYLHLYQRLVGRQRPAAAGEVSLHPGG